MSFSESRSYKRHGTRYKARRRAVDILFEAEVRDVDPVAVVEDRIELSQLPEPLVPPVNPYTRTIVEGVAVELDVIDEAIARFLADEWYLDRLPAVDRAILRVQCWELLFNPEVPGAVSVVEGVELGSEYSTPVASPYIHAVLDAINKHGDMLSESLDTVAGEETPESISESEEERHAAEIPADTSVSETPTDAMSESKVSEDSQAVEHNEPAQ